jgi:fumarylacetoacetase
MDYELEIGIFIGQGNALGDVIPVDQAESHVFGLCLLNDWSRAMCRPGNTSRSALSLRKILPRRFPRGSSHWKRWHRIVWRGIAMRPIRNLCRIWMVKACATGSFDIQLEVLAADTGHENSWRCRRTFVFVELPSFLLDGIANGCTPHGQRLQSAPG